MRQSSVFGKRREVHTVIIASGDHVRHFTIRPWATALLGSVLAAMAIGYLVATTYLVLRDDLIGAAVARQARMQQAYEDRIAALRSQVDRITSRQLLDQQLMEDKVAELLARQSQLTQRHGKLGPLLDRAGGVAPKVAPAAPVPTARPEIRAQLTLEPAAQPLAAMAYGPDKPPRRDSFASLLSSADRADQLFVAINRSLRTIEDEQLTRIRTLTEGAYETAGEIAEALAEAGLSIASDYEDRSVGGPLLPADMSTAFERQVAELDNALEKLDRTREAARRLPIANPAPGRPISSRFGIRRDPIIGTRAMHAGMDFRAPPGTPVYAAAPGTVVTAAWSGGYGRMVEIDHGDGFTTRYAHLSRISVRAGQAIEAGRKIGRVGSTGRSTGPHLHYEVRRNGDAVNPLQFLKAGRKLESML